LNERTVRACTLGTGLPDTVISAFSMFDDLSLPGLSVQFFSAAGCRSRRSHGAGIRSIDENDYFIENVHILIFADFHSPARKTIAEICRI